MSEASPTSQLRCIVVTPEETVLDATADFIAIPLFDGELGVGRGHSPMIGRLGYGELRLRTGSESDRYYVDGGFVQVVDNVVSVLTNRSLKASAVDTVSASEQLAEALTRKVGGEEALAIRDRQISQSRAQLRVGLNSK
ncbi:ATP synthase F1 subunit epsilon [Bythopirellula polymerisocia]|uniref:ATP synthase epsilon chain n=1 Tax=Bythopirellula polymerisocia TaxID=2528003 RepID=A0A5C6CV26_9BACT|nr:ATP synthase F1 subunit epsilon [Bythopirellula polymerisocia]TWU27357.1 ATP synthase epsilon chain, sodium ion specific [Bythopirellula polymerisocia]